MNNIETNHQANNFAREKETIRLTIYTLSNSLPFQHSHYLPIPTPPSIHQKLGIRRHSKQLPAHYSPTQTLDCKTTESHDVNDHIAARVRGILAHLLRALTLRQSPRINRASRRLNRSFLLSIATSRESSRILLFDCVVSNLYMVRIRVMCVRSLNQVF